MAQFGAHAAQQEREYRGYRWLWPGTPPQPPAIGFNTQVWVQETPRDIQPVLVSGFIAGAPAVVTGPETRVVIGRQEQPGHPAPALLPGIQGPNVRPALADSVFTTQETPNHPAPFLLTRIFASGAVYSAETRGLFTRQELPSHPVSIFVPSPQTQNVARTIRDFAITTQEQPFHPPPTLRPSFRVQNVARTIRDFAITRQERPFHPDSLVRPSFRVQNIAPVAPPAGIFVRQETPPLDAFTRPAIMIPSGPHGRGWVFGNVVQ